MFSGNWHPIVVHFPVALLCLYPLLMLAEYFWKSKRETLLGARILVLGVALLGVAASLSSGEAIQGVETINVEVAKTLQRHEMYAGLTNSLTWIAFVYALLCWIALHPSLVTNRIKLSKEWEKHFQTGVKFIQKWNRPKLHLLLALLLGLAVGLTGSEGGKLSYLYRVNAITCEPVAHPLGGLSKSLLPFVQPEHPEHIGTTPAFDVRCREN
ncbi:MAG: hypothetical protein K9M51_01520 [Candidatus Gracilibacteria bacterium]|nr:hypothetical protein [Candidatus Gracilibacteria bacterium]